MELYNTRVGRAVVFIFLGMALSGFGLVLLRGNEDTWICQKGAWTQHGHPRASKPKVPCPVKGERMKLSSSAIEETGELPMKYTCQGDNASPPLTIADIPPVTRSLALTLDDPDAPNGTFHHLIVWNIAPDTKTIGENEMPMGSVVGNNSAGLTGYAAPCPPSGTHRYIFTLYALDEPLTLPAGATRAEFDAAIAQHRISEASLTSKYTKQ